MKRILCLIISVIMVVGIFAACGAKTEQKQEDTKPAAAAEKKEEPWKEEPKKETTLHIIHWNQLGKNVIEKFEKENTGIKIQLEQFPVDKFI